MSIIDSNYLKAMPIPIKDSQWDAIGEPQIQLAIDEAEEYIQDYLDREIPSAYYTEFVHGRGRATLVLEQYPITYLYAISSIDELGVFEGYNVSSFSIDAEAGMVSWKNKVENIFESGKEYIVSYQAGYYPVPITIKKAISLQALEMLQPIFRKTNTAMSMVDLVPNSTEMIVELLEKYRRKRIG